MRVKDEIVRRLREGCAYNRIAAEVGCSKATVAYHAKQIGVAPGFRVYPWPEIQQYYDADHSMKQCMKKFGFSCYAWYAARDNGQIIPRVSHSIPLATLMQEGRRTGRSHLKGRLLSAGLLKA